MIGISNVTRERHGAPVLEFRTRQCLRSYRGAVFSCCASAKPKTGEDLVVVSADSHRGGSK